MNSLESSGDRWGDRLMRLVWPKPPATVGERTRRRIALHLIPYLFFLYILAYIDRTNIGVAKLAMSLPPEQGGLGFDDAVIGWGFGIFFWGYWILEIPSTLSIERWGARSVFVRILILWGLSAAILGGIGTAWMSSAFGWLPRASEHVGLLSSVAHFYNGLAHEPRYQFYFFRFMLGFFEGGFFPSVIVYIALWFRREDRAKAIAGFALAMPLSSVIGSPISGLLLRADWFGIVGWRWVYIVEGIVPILAGIATIFLLPNRPSDVRWLAADERSWLAAEMERERLEKNARSHVGWRNHLVMVLLLTAVYFCTNVSAYGLSTFMPSLFKQHLDKLPAWALSWLGLTSDVAPAVLEGRRNLVASLLTTLPFVVAVVVLLFNGRHSDRKRERVWHAAVPMAVMSLAIFSVWALAGWPLTSILILIFVVGGCFYTYIPPFWSIPTMFLGAGAAASAIGFINMTGNLGGSVGPYLLGINSKETDIWTALIYVAPFSFCGALILLGMDWFRRRKEASVQSGGKSKTSSQPSAGPG